MGDKPLSANQADDRIKAALAILGTAPGDTVATTTALKVCRVVLEAMSQGVIAADEKRDRATDPPAASVQFTVLSTGETIVVRGPQPSPPAPLTQK